MLGLTGGVALALHFGLRAPGSPPLLLHAGGTWALPERGLFGLSLGPGTAYTAAWVRLSLVDAAGGATPVLLLADQLDSEDWRALQVAVRECDTVDAEGAGRGPRSRSGP